MKAKRPTKDHMIDTLVRALACMATFNKRQQNGPPFNLVAFQLCLLSGRQDEWINICDKYVEDCKPLLNQESQNANA